MAKMSSWSGSERKARNNPQDWNSRKARWQDKSHRLVWQEKVFEMNLYTLHLCYSKYGPWTGSINITWRLVQNADSQARTSPTESEPAYQRDPQWYVYRVSVRSLSQYHQWDVWKSQSIIEGPYRRAERPRWAQVRAVDLRDPSPTLNCRTNIMGHSSMLQGEAVMSSSRETELFSGISDQRGSCQSLSGRVWQYVSLPYFLTCWSIR